MRCRYSCSRTFIPRIGTLAVFFAAFCMGFFAADTFSKFYDWAVPAELRDAVRVPLNSVDEGNSLSLEYRYSLEGVDSLDAEFVLTNRGAQKVTFLSDSTQLEKTFTVIYDHRRESTVPLPAYSTFSKLTLKPGESAYVSVPVPKEGRPFTFTFYYYVGEERYKHFFTLNVDRQRKTYNPLVIPE